MPDLESVLSSERLTRYPGATLDEQLEVYRWNVQLCQALYPTFHYFEVALRNRVHRAFTGLRGTPWWFEDPGFITHPYATQAVQEVRNKVKGRAVVPGDVVAGVTFGFWRGLFFPPFENAWRAVAGEVFPNAPAEQATRKALNGRLASVLEFRNRVFHHEPVFHWQDLAKKHAMMQEMLAWLSSAAAEELAKLDTFPVACGSDPRTRSA